MKLNDTLVSEIDKLVVIAEKLSSIDDKPLELSDIPY